MADVLLTTLNAKYAHASFGLRYLLANLGETRERAEMVEFDINQRVTDIVEGILSKNPKIVGLGVYIWNARESLEVVGQLKRLRPDVTVILGGPEVSYEVDQQEICRLADFVITGEGDLAFAELCRDLLRGRRPLMKVIAARLPEMDELQFPYPLYAEQDLKHRVVYVEASRGCPFKCEFCLSSLDVPVRNAPLQHFLQQMQALLDRGLRQFKFVDRTFNLNLNISKAILQFFLDRYTPGLFLHFEMIPDRLPEALRALIKQFPPGSLQFEVGVQTLNDDVSDRISRRQDNRKLEENLKFLRDETGVHVHADLIAGLPGEDLESFGKGFDRLLAMRPQEIQVGILKRLRGTPICRHDEQWKMVYAPGAPYEILSTSTMDFSTLQRIRRFARYWDVFANSGNFASVVPMLFEGRSAFETFMRFSDWLHVVANRTHGIALKDQGKLLFEFLTKELSDDPVRVGEAIWSDYQKGGRNDRLEFLKGVIEMTMTPRGVKESRGPVRQARHIHAG